VEGYDTDITNLKSSVSTLEEQVAKLEQEAGAWDSETMGGTIAEVVTKIQSDLEATNAKFATYLPLAGGAVTGPIALGNAIITGMAAPTDPADAVTKAYADQNLPLAGGKMAGAINMGNKGINNLLYPVADGDASNKKYVDDQIATVEGSVSA